MRLLNKFSESTLRALFLLIALYSLIITVYTSVNLIFFDQITTDDCLWVNEYNGKKLDNGVFITEIIPGGVADKAGLKQGDILTEINGNAISNGVEAMKILNAYKDEYIIYTVTRDNQVVNFEIYVYKFFNVLLIIFSTLGLGFLFVAFLVGYSKPKELSSQLFFFLGCAASSGILVYPSSVNNLQNSLFLYIHTLFYAVTFHPLFIHFFLTYPIKYSFKGRKKVLIALYLIPPLAALMQRLLKFIFNSKYETITGNIIFVLITSYILIGIIIFIISYKKINDEVVKKSLKIILNGFLIGLAGFIYFGVLQIINRPIFLVNAIYFLPVLLVLAIPFSFGFSIFKYRILDTEFIIKKGLVFGVATILIIGVNLLFVFLINLLFADYFTNKQFLAVIIILIVILTFDFLNKKAKEFVDKMFYRERYNYRQSLLEFSKELTYYSDINEGLVNISSRIQNIMNLSSIDLILKNPSYSKLFNTSESGSNEITKTQKTRNIFFIKLLSIHSEPVLLNSYFLIENKFSSEEIDFVKSSGLALVLPINIKNKTVGSINLSNKLSGKAYSDEDIDLLKTIAYQFGIALENARLRSEEIEKLKIEKELLIARNIQQSLLPDEHFNMSGIDIACSSKSAKYIGGDFCDYIKINENELLLVVADVSGKGIPAALYMTKVQTMIQFAAKVIYSPKDILIEINKQIYPQIERNSFITMIIARFNVEKRKVTLARAGHNPVLYHNGKEIITLNNKGIGLGLESKGIFESNLEEIEIDFNINDLFLFYSDGLTEAMNKNREEFGLDNLKNILTKSLNSTSLELKNKINAEVDAFRGDYEQNDDITFVTVKIVN
jgi:serine phosphatase RsbU (regulator of sigma subunit)